MRKLWPVIALLLSACKVGSDYQKPETIAPKKWIQQSSKLTKNSMQQEQWWLAFNDAALNTLIERTLRQNHDRKIAWARIIEARGMWLNSASALYPQTRASSTGGRANLGFFTQNNTLSLYQGNFDATWELDLFGGTRRSIEASQAMIGNYEASYHDLTLTLISEVVREYATLRELQRRYEITQRMSQSQKQLARLSAIKYKHGAANTLDVSQTQALYRDTQAQLPVLAKGIIATTYRISVLTGTESNTLIKQLQIPAAIPVVRRALILDAPAAVISRRPDVAAAERNLAAKTALTAVAISALYPKISLSSLFGWQNTNVLASSMPWSALGGITMPLLNFGSIRGNIQAADARQHQAFETYKQSVIAALADVETKLSDYSKSKEHSIALNASLQSNRNALVIARKRYEQGLTPLINVLETQTRTYAAENAYITAQAEEIRAIAALEKAGGL